MLTSVTSRLKRLEKVVHARSAADAPGFIPVSLTYAPEATEPRAWNEPEGECRNHVLVMVFDTVPDHTYICDDGSLRHYDDSRLIDLRAIASITLATSVYRIGNVTEDIHHEFEEPVSVDEAVWTARGMIMMAMQNV